MDSRKWDDFIQQQVCLAEDSQRCARPRLLFWCRWRQRSVKCSNQGRNRARRCWESSENGLAAYKQAKVSGITKSFLKTAHHTYLSYQSADKSGCWQVWANVFHVLYAEIKAQIPFMRCQEPRNSTRFVSAWCLCHLGFAEETSTCVSMAWLLSWDALYFGELSLMHVWSLELSSVPLLFC